MPVSRIGNQQYNRYLAHIVDKKGRPRRTVLIHGDQPHDNENTAEEVVFSTIPAIYADPVWNFRKKRWREGFRGVAWRVFWLVLLFSLFAHRAHAQTATTVTKWGPDVIASGSYDPVTKTIAVRFAAVPHFICDSGCGGAGGGGGGTSSIDDTAFTVSLTAFTPAGGVFNDAAAALVAGQQATARITAYRGLHTNLRSAAGVEQGVVGNPLYVQFAVAQPISAASLPLPAGAATAAKQPALGVAGTASLDVITVQGIAGMTPVKTDGSGVTQPVSAASLPLPTGASTETTLAGVKTGTDKIPALGQALAAGSVPVVLPIAQITTLTPPAAITNYANETGGNLAAIKTDVDKIPTQGQALAAASMPVVLPTAQITTLTPPAAITNFANETGGNLAAIKTDVDKIPALGQAAMAASAPVTIANNQSAVPISGTVTTTPPSNASTNVAQYNGVVPLVNNGTAGPGSPRVAIASDNTPFGVLPTPTAAAAQAVTDTPIVSAASTNSTSGKASAGNLYGFELYNTTTTVYYLRLYNLAAGPTCSSATGFVRAIPIPPAPAAGQVNGVVNNYIHPVNYTTGIAWCITGGSASTDNTSAAVGIFGAIHYE